ncbi:MAG: PQQ-dependent sugar dehydrogenase [bacterium]
MRNSALIAAMLAATTALLGGCGGQALPAAAAPTLASGLPEVPAELERSASYDSAFLLSYGDEYRATLPSNRVTAAGDSLLFSPDWDPGSQAADATQLAYAMYSFPLADYPGPDYIDLHWNTETPAADYWVGIADPLSQRWQWTAGAARIEPAGGFEPWLYPSGELLLAVLLSGTQARTLDSLQVGTPLVQDELPVDEITVPEGFRVSLFAYPVANARAICPGPDDILFVGTRSGGQSGLFALQDLDNDTLISDSETHPIYNGYTQPCGVDYRDGHLYWSDISRIWRAPVTDLLGAPPAAQLVSDAFPTEEHHGWKFIRFGPDGKLYVPVGAPCNICDEGDPYNTIMRMDSDGSNLEIVARGIRNTVGFDWHPLTGELWFTDNGRDSLGDGIPPDELNRIPADFVGTPHFGYPHWHGSDIPDPVYGGGHSAAEFELPAQELVAHCAALGMRFYDGEMFPQEYRNQIFIAEHGDWNNFSDNVGCRVTLVRLNEAGTQAISYEPFATGWQRDDAQKSRWDRPADVHVLPDGSMLVSGDQAGAIYRITYHGN